METQLPPREQANIWAQVSGNGFTDSARYLQSVPESEWEGPSGCSEWTIRHLAGHIVGEAVWFPNLVRGATRGEDPYPGSLYPEMSAWEPRRITERIAQAADEIPAAVDEATEEQLQSRVDLGFDKLPLWHATLIGAMEGAIHNWDAKAGREAHARIPHEWARAMAPGVTDFAAILVHPSKVSQFPGTYLIEVEDLGPTTITARDGDVSIEKSAHSTPDVTLILTPDEYVRMLTGRLGKDLESIRAEGDRERVVGLTRIFGGVANGD